MREDDLKTPPIGEGDENGAGAAEDGSDDVEILDILAFEQERVRSWKRRSNALLAALRRHHPERDPQGRSRPDRKRRGKGQPRGVSDKEPSGVSGKEPRGVSAGKSGGEPRGKLASPPLQPISNGTMRAAHVLGDSTEQRASRGDAESLPGFEIARIKRAICRYYGVTMTELLSPRRQAHLVRARQVGVYVARIMTARSLPEIGRHFGDRDHTTVLHAVNKIEADLDSYREDIAAIRDALV